VLLLVWENKIQYHAHQRSQAVAEHSAMQERVFDKIFAGNLIVAVFYKVPVAAAPLFEISAYKKFNSL
jgi:hypothetical protein